MINYNGFMWGTRYTNIITLEQAIRLLKSEVTTTEIMKLNENQR